MTERAVIFSGGVGHPFADTSAELARLLSEHGWAAEIFSDLNEALERLAGAGLLVVNALAWSMTQDAKYAPMREQWAFTMSAVQMDQIAAFAESGGKLLVMHTGLICFDSQPRWRRLLGGGWTWHVSYHPPYGPFTVQLTEAGQALSNGPATFEIEDEAYHHLAPDADCLVLAAADLGAGPQPLAWTKGENIAVDALGHDVRALSQPGHRALLDGMLRKLRDPA